MQLVFKRCVVSGNYAAKAAHGEYKIWYAPTSGSYVLYFNGQRLAKSHLAGDAGYYHMELRAQKHNHEFEMHNLMPPEPPVVPPLEKRNPSMNNSMIVFLINDSARAIMAQYEDGKQPYMFKTLDPTIKKDDLVVVQTGTRHGYTVVKVTAVDVDVDFESGVELKWVVDKVDLTDFETTLELEAQAASAVQQAELRRKKAALRETLFKDQESMMNGLALANHSETPVTE